MNILIIGGAGFLGSNLVRRCLLDAENRVTVLDNLHPELRSTAENLRDVRDRIRFVEGGLADGALLSGLVSDQHVIFNCAAQSSHLLSLSDPLLDAEINCLGSLRLLEAIRHGNRDALVVYTSSSTVIGKATTGVVDEDHPEHPLDIYSANKGVAEKYYRIYHRVHGVKTVVLRFPNLYGPYGKPHPEFGFINHFIHLAWAGRDLPVFGPGDQVRSVLYAGDAAEILYLAAREGRLIGETFFAAHDEHLSVREIAQGIVRVMGRGRVVHRGWPPERVAIEIDRVRISSARLRAITGWRPRHSFEQGMEKTRRAMEGGVIREDPDHRGARPYRVATPPKPVIRGV